MVRALKERWEAMGTHPVGRWARLALEVVWYFTLAMAVWLHWSAPQAYFSYMGM